MSVTKKKGVKIITSPIDFWWNKIKKENVDSEGLFFLFLGVDLPVGAVMRICPRVPSSKIADDKPLAVPKKSTK